MPASHTLNNQRSSDRAPKQRGARSEPCQAASQALTSDAARNQLTLAAAGAASAADILNLQRKVGNRAVQSLLAQRAVQPKLSVGPAGDRYEQEADRVADQVLTMPVPPAGQPPAQRTAEEDEDGNLQAKPLGPSITPLVQRQADEEEALQAKAQDSQAEFEAGSAIEGQLRTERGNGSPLPADVRSFMEPRFGADFSGVRVHTGHDASQLNRQLSAQAFTHGKDIYVGDGKFSPGSEGGRRLLAHELTHVVQQGAARTAGRPRESLQRAFGFLSGIGKWFKNIKKSKLAKKYTALKSHIAEEQKEPTKADQHFKVSIAMVTGSVVRSKG
jgi:hypothetical protein